MNEIHLPNVLHIEDNSDISLIVAKILSKIANITHVDNLDRARSKLAEGEYDLAILDLVLPDGSGLDLVDELKNRTPPMPVIIHSAHEVSDNIHNVDAVLSKMHMQHDILRNLVLKLTDQRNVVVS
ncbi:MAG: response regulator [Gammaproteobacteria bacterium]|nr:response regulator [Gammaproteobacteria bacterium]